MGKTQRYVSDELTHFVGRGRDEPDQYDLLVRILQEGRLSPPPHEELPASYAPEVVIDPSQPLSGNRAYEPRVVCLTDIPVGDLDIHIAKYSRFGISFTKPFCVEQGANPVFYVASQSHTQGPAGPTTRAARYDEMQQRFQDMRRRAKEHEGEPLARDVLELARFLDYEVFSFLKFFAYPLDDADPENYYMEREWRLHGELRFALRDVRRVILPERWARRFRDDFPDYAGQLIFG